MPSSKDQASAAAQRLMQGLGSEALTQRLQPQSPDHKPLPASVPHDPGATAQRHALLEAAGHALPHVRGKSPQPGGEALQGNIENFIGFTQIPTGLLGPLRVNGLHAQGDFYVPLATSEGALVASYNRGAGLASQAGGITAVTLKEQVQRAPGFAFANVTEAALFAAWAVTQFEAAQAAAATRTRHGRLLEMRPHLEGNHLHLILDFHTGDASGQNMVTLCADAVVRDLLTRSPIQPQYWFIDGNMSGDKKPTVLSLLEGRGRKVSAELTLPAALVQKGLHTTPERMCEYWRMSFVGGAFSGSIGVAGHFSNGLAALFLATGQDVACVGEASIGFTRMELKADGSLYVVVTLPNLIVGTVGGGTSLPTAAECLAVMDCKGEGKAAQLAEICAAVALCGEISIIGAICAGEFAAAHQRLGRKA
jgi:hydroxymethylglutaryl-CoA reductase (NADPH)